MAVSTNATPTCPLSAAIAAQAPSPIVLTKY